MGGVEEVGEEEADELEGHGDHAVPDKGEEGADKEAVDVDVVRGGAAGGEDGVLPVGGCGVGGRLFIGLVTGMSVIRYGKGVDQAESLQVAFLLGLRRARALRLSLRRRRRWMGHSTGVRYRAWKQGVVLLVSPPVVTDCCSKLIHHRPKVGRS